MLLQIIEKVDVVSAYVNGVFLPSKLRWRGRVYKIEKLGYRHKVKVGNALHHIFSVATNTLAFRLNFDTEILSWTLEEVSDGLAN